MSVEPALRTTQLAGVELHALDEAGTIAHVMSALEIGKGGWLVNPNVDVLRQIERDPQVRRLVGQATLVVADGAPLEWAARLAGTPLPPRVPGSTLIWSLSKAAARSGRSIFLLGGAPGVAERAVAALTEDVRAAGAPELRVAGTHCPPLGFENDPAELAAIRAALAAAQPDIVFCGLGFPKQEKLISWLVDEFSGTWFIGSGASLAFAAGEVARAPQWLRRIGAEWVFRLVSEPRRLARRYLVHDAPYALGLLARSALAGRRARRSS
ncbi:MAG TPA: WecB/TagA/CpsF family glycosyltransferase [Mycobacteriales bacterium]|jgi:N-acetylglucosaminyldiphosphoundecaprenol N-acetyl-beta-D-mannosaminyltransferase|nr:WecB/TagA/CpsF family glycosyltransferase [Mycobacteriales bacterium]